MTDMRPPYISCLQNVQYASFLPNMGTGVTCITKYVHASQTILEPNQSFTTQTTDTVQLSFAIFGSIFFISCFSSNINPSVHSCQGNPFQLIGFTAD